jgi:hypothetical protein
VKRFYTIQLLKAFTKEEEKVLGRRNGGKDKARPGQAVLP